MVTTRRVTTKHVDNKQNSSPLKKTPKKSAPVPADLFDQPEVVNRLGKKALEQFNEADDPHTRYAIISQAFSFPEFNHEETLLGRRMAREAPDLHHGMRFMFGFNQATFSVIDYPTRDLDIETVKKAIGITAGEIATRPMPDSAEYWNGAAIETRTPIDAKATVQVRALMLHGRESLVLAHQDASGNATRYLLALYPNPRPDHPDFSLVCVKEELGSVGLL